MRWDCKKPCDFAQEHLPRSLSPLNFFRRTVPNHASYRRTRYVRIPVTNDPPARIHRDSLTSKRFDEKPGPKTGGWESALPQRKAWVPGLRQPLD